MGNPDKQQAFDQVLYNYEVAEFVRKTIEKHQEKNFKDRKLEYTYKKRDSMQSKDDKKYDAWEKDSKSSLNYMRYCIREEIHSFIKKKGLPTEWYFDRNFLGYCTFEGYRYDVVLPLTYFGKIEIPFYLDLDKMKPKEGRNQIWCNENHDFINGYTNRNIPYFSSEYEALNKEHISRQAEYDKIETEYKGAIEHYQLCKQDHIKDILIFIIKLIISIGISGVAGLLASGLGNHFWGSVGEIACLIIGFLACFWFNWYLGLDTCDSWEMMFALRDAKRELSQREKEHQSFMASPALKRLKEIQPGSPLYEAAKAQDMKLRAEDAKLAYDWQKMWYDAVKKSGNFEIKAENF